MSSSKNVIVDRGALLTMLLHAAKHPTSAVCGLLLGELRTPARAPGTSPPTSPRASMPKLHVLDAVPVLHSFITLTPLLECALAQVRSLHQVTLQSLPAWPLGHALESYVCILPLDPQVEAHVQQQQQQEGQPKLGIVGYYQVCPYGSALSCNAGSQAQTLIAPAAHHRPGK